VTSSCTSSWDRILWPTSSPGTSRSVLIRLCRLVVMERPGYRADMGELERLLPGIASRVHFINSPQLDISSTDIQRRVRERLPIKYQVPEAVEDYIYEHELYAGKGTTDFRI